jgi:hypothetical protein
MRHIGQFGAPVQPSGNGLAVELAATCVEPEW